MRWTPSDHAARLRAAARAPRADGLARRGGRAGLLRDGAVRQGHPARLQARARARRWRRRPDGRPARVPRGRAGRAARARPAHAHAPTTTRSSARCPPRGCSEQGRRCMDCGIPFCHQGCPLGNLIPEWNDLVRRGEWRVAIDRLHATNNFPEFTGLICPAPCEASCVLAINDDPVMIKQIEWGIIERAFREGWVRRQAAAAALGLVGRRRRLRAGGAGVRRGAQRRRPPRDRLRARRGPGRPDPARRAGLQAREVDHRPPRRAARGGGDRVPSTASTSAPTSAIDELNARHDAVVLALGARVEREIDLPGGDLGGIHTAMDLPAAAQPRRRRAAAARRRHHRRGQARRRDRRRRHRRGLRRLGPPRARGVGHPARHLPAARGHEVPRARAAGRTSRSACGRPTRSTRAASGAPRSTRPRSRATAACRRSRATMVGDPPDFEPTGESHEMPADLVLIAIGFTGVERGLVDQLGVARRRARRDRRRPTS